MGWFLIRWVSLLLTSTFPTLTLRLYAALLQRCEQYCVVVVQAVNSLPQCWQIRCTSILELIWYLLVLLSVIKRN